MTPLQQEPSVPAPWMRTMFGRVFILGFLSWSCLAAILRRKAAAGVSAALLHFADACCAAGVAVPPAWPGGKGPRDFGLDRDKQLAGVRQRAEIIQLPPTTPALADRTLGAADRGARRPTGFGRVREHQRRTRQRRTRSDRGTGQEFAWHTAVIPPAGPGVRRSASRGPAIRFARCWVLQPRPRRRCHRQVMPAADPRGRHPLSTVPVAA